MDQTITFLEDDATSRVIGVEEIFFAAPAMTVLAGCPIAAESDDDDVPIAAILETKAKKNTKRKKVKQQRWDYVQVAEPTGVASNYWDAAAPVERATKRVAKQKIREIQDGELNAALLPDDNLVSVVPDIGDAARKENVVSLDAAVLPDGNVVSLVPDVGVVARKEKTKRTATQRRTDLEAMMEQQRRIDLEGVTIPTVDDMLTLSTGSGTTTQTCVGKPKVFPCCSLRPIESPSFNCFLSYCVM